MIDSHVQSLESYRLKTCGGHQCKHHGTQRRKMECVKQCASLRQYGRRLASRDDSLIRCAEKLFSQICFVLKSGEKLSFDQ